MTEPNGFFTWIFIASGIAFWGSEGSREKRDGPGAEHQPDEQFHPCGIFRASRPSGYPLPSVSGDLLRDSGVEPGPHHPDRGGVTPPLPHVFLPRSSLCLGDHDHIPYRPRDALGVGCSLGCRQHLWLHVLPSSSCTLLWAPQSLHWWERWLWTVTWLSVTP